MFAPETTVLVDLETSDIPAKLTLVYDAGADRGAEALPRPLLARAVDAR